MSIPVALRAADDKFILTHLQSANPAGAAHMRRAAAATTGSAHESPVNVGQTPARPAPQVDGDIVTVSGAPGAKLLPSNLCLERPPRAHGKLRAALEEAAFRTCAIIAMSLCTAAAVLPNLYCRLTKRAFSPGEIEGIKARLQPGDVVLGHSDMHQAFSYFLRPAFGGAYDHTAMYVGDGMIVDCYDSVLSQPLEKFLAEYTHIAVLRPQYASPEQPKKAREYLERQVGKEYSLTFDTTDEERFYCSSIILRGLERSGFEGRIPGHTVLNHPFVLPGDFFRSKDLDVVEEFVSGSRNG